MNCFLVWFATATGRGFGIQNAIPSEFGQKWRMEMFLNENRILTLGPQVPFAYPTVCVIQREAKKSKQNTFLNY